MRIRVLFFGVLKDVIGRAACEIELPAGASARTVFEHCASQFPKLRAMERSILLARNQRFVRASEPVADGDEIALLPPVSGGTADAGENFFALTRAPIDTRGLAARLLRGEDGAVVAFEGVVRNNSRGRRTLWLDYECYEPMALKLMAEIGAGIARTREIGRIAIVHRLGRLEIGETSVAVVVTAPHRRPAFKAALEGIDRLKRTVPIWKKEHFEDGEVWVEGEWDESLRNP
ncbi:MAG: molybdenum cofactor biosynthesis protein MoaE [Bryobacteraceae bacterium]